MNAPSTLRLRVALDEPVTFLRREAKLLIGISVMAHIVVALPGLMLLPFIDLQAIVGPDASVDTTALLSLLGASAIGAVIGVPVTIALYEACRLRLDGQPVDRQRLIGAATRPRLLLTVIGTVTLGLMGLVMCILPGGVAVIATALWLPVMLHEDVGVLQGARRGVGLLSHRVGGTGVGAGWIVAVVFIVWIGWAIFANTLGSLASAAYTTWAAVDSASRGSIGDPSALIAPWWLTTLVSIVTVLIRAVIDLYPAIAMLMLYRSIMEERDGTWFLEQLRQGGS